MDQDEKTARPPRAGAVRSTAPAGTPYPVAPMSPPPAAAPTESQPRTVGGHTARLLIAEDDPLDFDSLPGPPPTEVRLSDLSLSDVGLSDVGLSGLGLPDGAAPPSATVGGTMRLATVSPDSAAAAQSELARQEGQKRAAPPGGPDAPSKAAAGDASPGKVPPPLTSAVSGPAGEGGSSTLALLLAPASVAVGLVFFAMGSMIALTIEGRLIRFSVALPGDTVAASSSAPPSASSGRATHAVSLGETPRPPAAAGGLAAAMGETSATPGSSASAAAPHASGSAVRPPVPAAPPNTGRPQGGGKLKPIIF